VTAVAARVAAFASEVASIQRSYDGSDLVFVLVGRLGLEPRTHGLKVRCSTIELTPRRRPPMMSATVRSVPTSPA
jgi:hypothetical protein